jgi:glycosyltransferase involved in cell wall biosynthesis
MRVLLVEHKTVWGGGQVALWNVLCEWQRTRAPLEPVLVCPPDAELAPRVRALGIETVTFDLGAIEKTRSVAWNFAQRVEPTTRLLRVMQDVRAEVVLANCAYSFLASVFAAKLSRTPVIWLEQTTTLPSGNLLRRMMSWADRIVAVSEAIRTQFVALAPDAQQKMTVIYNGVDTERFAPRRASQETRRALGLAQDARVVGAVSRLSPEKGIEFFIAAANALARDAIDVRFLIVGDGPERARLEKIANGAVIFLGQRDEIPELLHAMDVFVLPSLAEGFGMAAAEAMACGLPVIASDVGGLREIVAPNETGILVPPREANALANAILELLHDENKRRAFGERGRARVEQNFTLAHQAQQLQIVLEGARKK